MSATPSTDPTPSAGELELRHRLGIPDHAERVLVVTETSHWDPDWLLTSEGYFALRVRRNLRQAIDQLLAEPRRVYSVECVFFLRMFYERVPAYRGHVRRLVEQGRLRLMGSGVTTPDTIVPPAELLVRDYLLGQEWLRSEGMTVEPAVAFFPDTFGFSPGLPDVLGAVGVSGAAVCRIDGMYFAGNETEPASRFPRPGTSAHLLAEQERSLDVVWRGPGGAELLCHWLAFTYGQAELFAHVGITRQSGAPLAVPWRTDALIRSRVERYVGQLAPLSRTPYLLCPMGGDFSAPVPGLVGLFDRYNERHAAQSGTWVVNAGLDDYLALVDHHRDQLPTVELDPSQYFTGFFTARPTLKRRYAELTEALGVAERLSLSPDLPAGTAESVARRLEGPWWTAATANHHDFVTGTAPDRVVRREQLPWLDDALEVTRSVIDDLAAVAPEPEAGPIARSAGVQKPIAQNGSDTRAERGGGTRRAASPVEVEAGGLRLVFDPAAGGALVSLATDDGEALLGGPSLGLVSYADSGGLWRMGNEYGGGRFEPVERSDDRPVRLEVSERPDGSVEVEASGTLGGHPWRRVVVVADGRLRVQFELTVGDRTTVTMPVVLAGPASHLVTDVSGGVVRRPARAWYEPTFWSVRTFAHVRLDAAGDDQDRSGVALLFGLPGAVTLRPAEHGRPATLEAIAARNATKEMAYRVVPLPAQPARGHDPGPHRFDLVLAFTGADDWRAAGLPALARAEARRANATSDAATALAERADRVVATDRDDVVVVAAKLAHRGAGAIVRLDSTAPGPVPVAVRWAGVELASAARCDGRERDLGGLDVDGDRVLLDAAPGLTTVRLVPRA